MKFDTITQRAIIKFQDEYYLAIWIEAFITDRKVNALKVAQEPSEPADIVLFPKCWIHAPNVISTVTGIELLSLL